MDLPINSGTWYAALEPAIKTWYNAQLSMFPSRIADVFNVMSSTQYQMIFQSGGSIGTQVWDHYQTSKGAVPSVGVKLGDEKTFTMRHFPVNIPIERTTIADGRINVVQQMIESVTASAMQKREEDGASVFNNAFSTSFVGGDGLPLCSGSHGSDNKLALDLSKTNLETARQAMYAFKNDTGSLVGAMPSLLIVPASLEPLAKELTLSQLNPETANNAYNSNTGLRYMVWNYLTDSDAWFLVDEVRMRQSLMWINREPFSIDLDTGASTIPQAIFHASMRYGYGFTDWRWVVGSEGAA